VVESPFESIAGRFPVSTRSNLLSVLTLFSFAMLAGCNYKGEDAVPEKDFAVSSTVKAAIGASGSTFVNPLMQRWIADFHATHPATQVNYRAIGSGAGLAELRQNTTEMAASDAPLTDEQLKEMPAVVQIPVAAGPVVAVYNLPTLKAPLRLSATTLAGIFLGNIISWQDAAVQRDNPGVQLPHAAIIVVHRSDGSGTTSILTSYLAKVSPEWLQKIGHGLAVTWPVGIGAKGSGEVLDFVAANVGTIGYAELNYASEKKLPVASIQNRAGSFVAPSSRSATATIEAFDDLLSKDVRTSVVDPPATAKEAYPIVGITFLVFAKTGSGAEQQAIREFVQYVIQDGQEMAQSLQYAKLPKLIQDRAVATVNGMPAPQPAKAS
jgi:phosphate transport system substrate-binding protein